MTPRVTQRRLQDYLEQMQAAAEKACAFLKDMPEGTFLRDERSQMAVRMALVLIGEAAHRIMATYPEVPVDHPQIPWSKIHGMRNLVVDDDYEVELPIVWQTVKTSLPDLVSQLDALRNWHAQGE